METTAKGMAPFVVGCATAGGARAEPGSEPGTPSRPGRRVGNWTLASVAALACGQLVTLLLHLGHASPGHVRGQSLDVSVTDIAREVG